MVIIARLYINDYITLGRDLDKDLRWDWGKEWFPTNNRRSIGDLNADSRTRKGHRRILEA